MIYKINCPYCKFQIDMIFGKQYSATFIQQMDLMCECPNCLNDFIERIGFDDDGKLVRVPEEKMEYVG